MDSTKKFFEVSNIAYNAHTNVTTFIGTRYDVSESGSKVESFGLQEVAGELSQEQVMEHAKTLIEEGQDIEVVYSEVQTTGDENTGVVAEGTKDDTTLANPDTVVPAAEAAAE